ncbi:hypothetical protein QBC44DRAFT_388980 [Cladorrhinum sp. PSN332]|nr:hypothetical protein QBC44DRAFT_388980 [Cladorrhinum sp. PSN332]
MSLHEIYQLIQRKGLTPQYLPDSMMKQITWDDQWIGYDDDETFAAKKAWADSKCFGGTMVWSIDFQISGSGDSDEGKYGDVVYIGSEVFQTPAAQCPAPCIMVFPSSTLPEPKVITMQPYTATLEVGTTATTMVAIATASTTTITVVNFFNHYVTSAQQPGTVVTLRPSFQPSPVMLVVTGQDSQTTTRTVLPPPLGGGYGLGIVNPPDPGSSSTAPSNTQSTILPPRTTAIPVPNIELPELEEFVPEDTEPPTPVFPSVTHVIEPVTDTNKPTPPGGTHVKCNSWFFFICISWIDLDLHVEWWDIVLPPGRIGPGPLPVEYIKLPPGWKLPCLNLGCLPPWPQMTVGAGGFPPEPLAPTPCEPVTATLTIESTSYGTTTTEGTVRTITTRTFSSEFPILGCALTDMAFSTSKTACAAPKATPRAVHDDTARGASSREGEGEGEAKGGHDVAGHGLVPAVAARAPEDDCDEDDDSLLIDIALLPRDHHSLNEVLKDVLGIAKTKNRLESYTVVGSEDPVFVAFIYLTNIRTKYFTKMQWDNLELIGRSIVLPAPPPESARKRSADIMGIDNGNVRNNKTAVGRHQERHALVKRTSDRGGNWGPSHLGVPPRVNFGTPEYWSMQGGIYKYKYQRDRSECDGQVVYIIEASFDDENWAFEMLQALGRIETLPHQRYGNWYGRLQRDHEHATWVASTVAGMDNGSSGAQWMYLEALVEALKDIKAKNRASRSIINMSWRISLSQKLTNVLKLLLQEFDKLGVVLVTSAGNSDTRAVNPPIDGYPTLFAGDSSLPNLIVVGASNIYGRAAHFSKIGNNNDAVTVYAPGE